MTALPASEDEENYCPWMAERLRWLQRQAGEQKACAPWASFHRPLCPGETKSNERAIPSGIPQRYCGYSGLVTPLTPSTSPTLSDTLVGALCGRLPVVPVQLVSPRHRSSPSREYLYATALIECACVALWSRDIDVLFAHVTRQFPVAKRNCFDEKV